MKSSYHYYRRLVLGTIGLFLCLIILQVTWLRKAVYFQQEEIQQRLSKLVPDMALAINQINHESFHGRIDKLQALPIGQLESAIQAILDRENLSLDLSFALYQDTLGGLFISNTKTDTAALINSEIRACMTCIVSFSIAKKNIEQGPNESEEEFSARLYKDSEFQYFSPVNQLKSEKGETLWLALYLPQALGHSIQALAYIFVINILVLGLLLALFFYLIRALAKHKQLSQIKDDFFNNMTHEFKTPLSSIRLASKVLKESRDVQKNQIYHQVIEKETLRMEQQIDQLLGLSLLDYKELELAAQTIDLQHLIQEIPERLRLLIQEKRASLTLDLDLQDAQIKGDAEHLSNSICNLIENSLKYSPEQVQILISAYHKKNKKIIHVRDNGPGIPANFQQQIFERFFRGQKENQYKGQGFGIGLSYVKSIIEAHHGTIRLNTDYQSGCEFIIEL